MNQMANLSLTATLEDMKFWLHIMTDHSKLIRGGLEISEEPYIQMANNLAETFSNLLSNAQRLDPNYVMYANNLINQSIYYTTYLRNFKDQLYHLVNNCQVISKLPADLYHHVEEEANYFLTILCRYAGCPVPTQSELGIQGYNATNSIIARELIAYNKENILDIAYDVNYFWLDKNMEHPEVLLLIAFRPHIQEEFWNTVKSFENTLKGLFDEFKSLQITKDNIVAFQGKAIPVITSWRDYLENLYNKVFNCDVPSKGINADGSILDHMAREAQYYLDLMNEINEAI